MANMDEVDAALEIGSMHGFAEVPDDRLGEVISALSQLDNSQLEMMKYELPQLIERLPSDGPGLYDWMEYPKLLRKLRTRPPEPPTASWWPPSKPWLVPPGRRRHDGRSSGGPESAAGGELIG